MHIWVSATRKVSSAVEPGLVARKVLGGMQGPEQVARRYRPVHVAVQPDHDLRWSWKPWRAPAVTFPQRLDLGPTVLRRLRIDDAEAVYRRYASDPEVTRFLSFRTHDGVEDAAGFCTLMQVEWEAGRAFTFVMLEPGDPVPFGSIGVRIEIGRAHV